MSNSLNANKAGMALGILFGGAHLLWSLLVASGAAKSYVNWMMGLHMLQVPVVVMPFSLTTAVTLVVLTTVVGYVVGWIFAMVWNSMHR